MRARFPKYLGWMMLAIVAAGTPAALAQGAYIYPAKGQTQDQLNRDRSECGSWAVGQSGFDPARAQYSAPPQEGQMAGTAVKGAAIGAIGGAIGGNAGAGAAIGAASGLLIGGIRRRQQQQDYQNQASASAAQQSAYNRAFSACIQGRGYTVN
jgi:OmpA family protein